jgi:E3 ubiquitin-protein ligase MARCH6
MWTVMHIYPGIFTLFAFARSAVAMYGRMTSWSQAIRDKEFLVEMRLRNHEPGAVDDEGDIEIQLGVEPEVEVVIPPEDAGDVLPEVGVEAPFEVVGE